MYLNMQSYYRLSYMIYYLSNLIIISALLLYNSAVRVKKQYLIMLTRFIWRTLFTLANQKITNDAQKISMQTRNKPENYEFRIKLKKINDPAYFMEVINKQHTLNETNKMLNGIIKGVAGLNRNNFESIFKKYSFYIELIPKGSSYAKANLQEKLEFLDGVTQVYSRLGKLSSAHMIKSFNKVSDEIYNRLKQQLDDQSYSQADKQDILCQLIHTILCISRYNKNKAYALFMGIQKKLIQQKFLSKITIQTAINYMELMPNLSIFNRLIIETCVDCLKDQIQFANYDDIYKILYCLASSQYPINRTFVKQLVKRVNKQLNRQIDPTSGQAYAKNQFSLRQNLKILSSLSMIQVNMNLSSAYLPQLSPIYQIQLQDLGMKYISKMTDKDLEIYSSFLRRTSYYDQTLLQSLIGQVLKRNVKQIKQLDQQMTGIQSFDDQFENKKQKTKNQISLNTICAVIHTLAVYNYRHQGIIEYFIKVINLLMKTQKLTQNRDAKRIQNVNKDITLSKQKGVKEKETNFHQLVHHKYNSRIVWSLCVLGKKEQLAQIYPIFEEFFLHQYKNKNFTPGLHEMLNFYYCYLLLKTYFPKNTISFDKLMQELQQKQLISSISKTHQQLYKAFINAGIPALKQHNISNLMCDVFIPSYISRNGLLEVNNVIIDLHGPHHTMRNCDRIKGGSQLKKKILVSQGYIYQYVSVHEWQLVSNKSNFIIGFMENIAKKYGTKPKQNNQFRLAENEKNQDNLNQKQIIEHKVKQSIQTAKENDQETTTKINFDRKSGRRIKTNSLKLQSILNQRQKSE